MGDILGAGGTTTSFSNTPQAKEDVFLSGQTGLTEDNLTVAFLDVMGNDLGGNAKTLFSLDNGINNTGAMSGYIAGDLLTQDTGRIESCSSDCSAHGARIWITADGRVGYDATTLSAEFRASLQALNVGQYLTDTFIYAIRLGNGTLSWATATVQFAGANDAAVLSSDTRNLIEGDTAAAISTSGTLTISDVDSSATFQTQSNYQGLYGKFSIDASGHWTYVADSAHNEFVKDQVYTETFTVKSADGTSTSVTVKITGTNDAAVISGDTSGNVTEPIYAVQATATGALTDTDVDNASNTFQQVLPGASSDQGYGTFGITTEGSWTYTLDYTNSSVLALHSGQTLTDTFTVHTTDGTAKQISITIYGSDTTTVTLSGDTVFEGGTATVSASVDNAPDTDLVLTLSNGEQITIAAGELTGSVSFAVQDNSTYGDTHTSTITITDAAGGNYEALDHSAAAEITITDNDTAPSFSVNDVTVNEGAGTMTFTVTRTGATTAASSVDFATADGTALAGSDYTAASGTLNFAAGDTSKTVTVAITNDSVFEATETFNLNLSNAVNATISDNQGIGTITDNDNAPTLSVTYGTQGNKTQLTLTFPSAVDITTFTKADLEFVDTTNSTTYNLGDSSGGNNSPSSWVRNFTWSAGNTVLTVEIQRFTGNTFHNGTFNVLSSYNYANGAAGGAATISSVKMYPAGVAGEPISLALNHPDDAGQVLVTLTGVPDDWSLNSGQRQADGSWVVSTWNLGGLMVVTPGTFTGAAQINISYSWTGTDGTSHANVVFDNVEAYAPGTPIFAWSADDTLTGSAGADTFVFSQPIGADTIHDFDTGQDVVDLVEYAQLGGFADVIAHTSDDAAGNAVLDLGGGQSITFAGVHSADLTADNFEFDVQPNWSNSGSMTIGNGAMLPVSGALENSGTIELQGGGDATLLQIIQHGLTLTGGGSLVLNDNASNLVAGTVGSVILTNVDNTISGAGQVGGGSMRLVNGGTILADGSNALVIDTGTNVIANGGTLEATGTGGLSVLSALDNNGHLWANGGSLTFAASVSGPGNAVISGAGSVEFGDAASTSVLFDSTAAGQLTLDAPALYTGSIGGFDDNDLIDLNGIDFSSVTGVSYVEDADHLGGILSIGSASGSVDLHLSGTYGADEFTLAADIDGSTLIGLHHHDSLAGALLM